MVWVSNGLDQSYCFNYSLTFWKLDHLKFDLQKVQITNVFTFWMVRFQIPTVQAQIERSEQRANVENIENLPSEGNGCSSFTELRGGLKLSSSGTVIGSMGTPSKCPFKSWRGAKSDRCKRLSHFQNKSRELSCYNTKLFCIIRRKQEGWWCHKVQTNITSS